MRFARAIPVIRIHDEDLRREHSRRSALHALPPCCYTRASHQALRVLVVVPPQWSDLQHNKAYPARSIPRAVGWSYCSTLSCPPTSHTVKLIFLYSTVSTLNPIVGIVVTISPSFSLYKMVVYPFKRAKKSHTIHILVSSMARRWCFYLARCVQPNHQNTHLLFPQHPLQRLRDREPHPSKGIVRRRDDRSNGVLGVKHMDFVRRSEESVTLRPWPSHERAH